MKETRQAQMKSMGKTLIIAKVSRMTESTTKNTQIDPKSWLRDPQIKTLVEYFNCVIQDTLEKEHTSDKPQDCPKKKCFLSSGRFKSLNIGKILMYFTKT